MALTTPLLPIGEAAITLLNVDIAFEGHTILANVNQQFRPREFVAVSGPEGSGKTSLLRVIAGVDRPSRGAVLLGAHDLLNVSSADYQRQVMWIPTGPEQIELLDHAAHSNIPVIVIDQPLGIDPCVFTFAVLRLADKHTIICATNSQSLLERADYEVSLGLRTVTE